ncbi:hypothetical protein N7478_010873 [Penicillium angulare]|uniref:uncharacterized protein n=1 Tax=Penicillium angulare TaxID=116970 RepID=UPI002541BB62|nr:uncharacterized protein N7478_010873 [Penicillium angulare]KAJ5263268.1 hypothetical protein N7478_010873 [Penicillium angulare]
MKWLNSSSPGLVLRYTTEYVLSPIGKRYLGSADHPIRPKIAYMYENRERNTLWWRVSTSKIGDFKRVVRSWCARRARIAFREALKNQGYDELGIPLPDSPKAQTRRLTGSLEILFHPKCVNQSSETLQRDTDRCLEEILQRREKFSNRDTKRPRKCPGSSDDQ